MTQLEKPHDCVRAGFEVINDKGQLGCSGTTDKVKLQLNRMQSDSTSAKSWDKLSRVVPSQAGPAERAIGRERSKGIQKAAPKALTTAGFGAQQQKALPQTGKVGIATTAFQSVEPEDTAVQAESSDEGSIVQSMETTPKHRAMAASDELGVTPLSPQKPRAVLPIEEDASIGSLAAPAETLQSLENSAAMLVTNLNQKPLGNAVRISDSGVKERKALKPQRKLKYSQAGAGAAP